MKRPQRGLWTDAFDGDELLEKLLVLRAQKADQPWLQASAAGIALDVEHGVKCHFFTDTGRKLREIAGRDEQLAKDRTHAQMHAILIHAAKLAGQRSDHVRSLPREFRKGEPRAVHVCV